jgi:23S rRNA G2445 N2-methylase RlmL
VCFAGLADLGAREISSLGASNVASTRIRNYDRLSFGIRTGDIPRLRALRLFEDVLVDLGRIQRAERASDLARLTDVIRKDGLLRAIQEKNRFNGVRTGGRKTPTFACFVKQDRDRRLHRSEIANAVERLVSQQFPRWRASDPAQLEIWVFWTGAATFSLRLTDERFKYRGMRPPEREAALRPTIAAAMAAVAGPRDGETILDPMCGSGTLLIEARARNANVRLVGTDISRAAIDLAASRIDDGAALEVHDARKPLTVGPVDCILCNLPWGHRYAANARLYSELIENFRRALHPYGRMVLLTDQASMLEAAFSEHEMAWSRESRVLVRGKWANLYAARPGT